MAIDRRYIAPQLSTKEKLVAGVFTALDLFLLLFVVGVPVLVLNVFSSTYPRREKAINACVLLGVAAAIALLAAILIRR